MAQIDPGSQPLHRGQLAEFFSAAAKPDSATHLIGAELEKFAVFVGHDGKTLPRPATYREHISKVLGLMVQRFGWTEAADRGSQGEVVALVRGMESITLEPGGQFELSGAPLPTIHHIAAEFATHHSELDVIGKELGLSWMAAGFHPWARREDIDWMPKGRYQVMRDYLPTRGAYGLDMMLRTCTVQANYDYRDEQDCGRRFYVALALSPVVTAMFANDPYLEGQSHGHGSLRTKVWGDVDSARCGVPAFALKGEPFSYERYVDWALGVPMFFVYRDGVYHPYHKTFAEFMAQGFTLPTGATTGATWADWLLHLSTVFPDVRLKPYVEVRTVDSVPLPLATALPALWRGLLYDDQTLARMQELTRSWTAEDHLRLRSLVQDQGIDHPEIQGLTNLVANAAQEGLVRLASVDPKGNDESQYLAPLLDLVARKENPAARVRGLLGSAPGSEREARQALVRAFHFAGVMPGA